jgi:sulfate/thiosulfate transport system substrate-binding protein
MKTTTRLMALGALLAAFGLGGGATAFADDQHLLNVSYDATREFYQDFDQAFASYWRRKTGNTVTIDQSHGGSGSQAQAVINGLDADVVTLAVASDIDAIAETGLIGKDWQKALPDGSTPYTSTIVFLVRKGNPKGIHDFGDLIRDGVEVVTPNPKTSGAARWGYLAAWAWANQRYGGDREKIEAYIKALYQHVPVLDTGSRGSTITFTQKGIGDVLLSWENEAYLAIDEFGADKFDIVVPPLSIRADPPVAVVDQNAAAHDNTALARAYLNYLYSPVGQTLAAKHHYRPSHPELVTDEALLAAFPKLKLVTIDDPEFGGWAKVQSEQFGDGGIFDQIYQSAN